MSGETDEADLALLFGGGERFEDSIHLVRKFRWHLLVVNDIVYLPNVEMIGLQPGERLLKHAHGDIFFTAVRASYPGHKNRLPSAFALKTQCMRVLHPRLADTPGERYRRS